MLKVRQVFSIQKRWKGKKTHWSVLRRKQFTKDRALENFDDFYGSVFGPKWKSIRVALLTEHKYVAMVNIFGDNQETSKVLEEAGAINVKSLVELALKDLKVKDYTSRAKKSSKIENKLEEIITSKETEEKLSIYPGNDGDQIPSNISFSNSDAEKGPVKVDDETSIVNYKKSLDKAEKEDLDIDCSRLINLSEGGGGLYEFLPANKIKGMEDWIPESDHYKYYSTITDFPIDFQTENKFDFPDNVSFYTYEKSNSSTFIHSKKSITGVQSHYLLDGASILPPLMLGIQKGDKILDACAAPGGKSLIMLQTLYPSLLVCNDVSESRVNRIRQIMKSFVIDFSDKWDGKHCFLTQEDARSIEDYEQYDKILVDVPCTTDRHSVMENDNNIFKPTRIKERLKIPELQSAILSNCLRLLRPGGSLVYSTCSLSPIQNDGVVHMALQKCFTEYGITTTIKDLSFIIKIFKDIFKFENSKNMKYGQMVLPYLPANFGPMYFCKITRN